MIEEIKNQVTSNSLTDLEIFGKNGIKHVRNTGKIKKNL
jgi:hypothetical protein